MLFRSYLLDELKSEYRVKGIEIGDEAVRYCQARGLEVSSVSLEQYLEGPAETFDIIVISHVLEHLLLPDECLRQLKQRLNPDGRIFVLVPNYECYTSDWFGSAWGWWQVPVHINHFCVSSMNRLAERSGYAVISTRLKGGDSLM